MLIDLSSIIKVPGARLEIDGFANGESAEFLGETYRFPNPLKVEGVIYNNGQSLTLEAQVSGFMLTDCARCLEETEVSVDFEINELLSRVEDGADPDDEDIIIFEGHEIELDDIVTDNFLINMPGKYLCDEDCLGLCPTCGHNLNESDCGCNHEVIDPRWQALADIMNRQKDD